MSRRQEIIEELKKSFKPVEPGKRFVVKPFEAEDAMGVVKCCYSVYGEGYPVDTYYNPELLIEKNSNGDIYSIVAKTDEGEIIGYGALFRSSAPFYDMYEGGQYIIQNEYRGSRAAFQINNMIVEQAKLKGIAGLYGEAVTNHVISQKFGDRAGCSSTAVEIDLMPAAAYENDDRVMGRVSSLFQFVILKDSLHKIYLPEEYYEVIKDSVQDIKLKREIEINENGKLDTPVSNFEAEYYDFAGVGRLHVIEMGEDVLNIFNDFENEIVKRNYKVAQIFISLSQKNSRKVFETFAGAGYFYGGYMPRWVDKDAILLQKLIVPPTFENINLYPARAIEILDFIKSDYQRIIKNNN